MQLLTLPFPQHVENNHAVASEPQSRNVNSIHFRLCVSLVLHVAALGSLPDFDDSGIFAGLNSA
jgi:hypothetical protein